MTAIYALWACLFILIGLTFSLLGPAIPELRAEFALPISSGGLVFTMHSVGYLAGVLLTAGLADSWGRKRTAAAGTAGLALGMGLLALAPTWPLALAALVIAGTGFAFADVGLNAAIGEAVTGAGRRASLMNLLHAAFPVGTLIAPAGLALALSAGWSWRVVVGATAVASAAGLLGFLPGSPRWPIAAPIARSGNAGVWQGIVRLATLLRNPRLRTFALIQSLYIGAEVGVAGWIASYLVEEFGTSPAYGALASAAYWGGFLAGRPLIAALARRVEPHRMLVWLCGTGAFFGIAGVIAAHPLVAAGAYVLFGIAICGIFPTVMALAMEGRGEESGAVSSLVMGAASVGGLFWPWMIGVAAQGAGLRLAMIGTAAPLVVMSLLAQSSARGHQPAATPAVEPAA